MSARPFAADLTEVSCEGYALSHTRTFHTKEAQAKVETAWSASSSILNPGNTGKLENTSVFMQHALQTGKRVFSAAVAAATIAFTVGIMGLVQPATAYGASEGDLIKGSLSTVYYYGYDGMRYTFPNEKTYKTWYSDFSDVTTISDSALADIELGGNVAYRPGSMWVKIQSDPKVYAVSTDGMIHWIESEDVAEGFAGSDWASHVEDVPDAFFVDYTVGDSLRASSAYADMLWMTGGTYYVNAEGEMRSLSSAARSANNLQSRFFLDGSDIDTSDLSEGEAVTGAVTALTDAAQTEGWDDSGSATGDLEVSVSSSTAEGASLPGGANSVEVFSFDLDAGSEDASVDSVTITMTGAGATTNLRNVYLYEGSERLTEARSVNAATREATFSNLGLTVDAGDTRTLTVRVEVSSSQTAADTFGFSIESADAISASGDVDGDFPVEGETFTFTGQDVGYLDIDKSGSITNPTIGEQDAVIGQFKLAANNEAASVTMMTVKIDNASDHSDFWLWDGDEALVEGENTSSDYVLFDLADAPFAIADGSSNIFTVSADIGGQATDTVKVFFDNEVDVEAIGGDFDFGLCVDIGDAICTGASALGSYDGASCTSTSGDCSYSTVQGGDVTITHNGPSAGDIQVNSQDQVLLEFTISSAEEVTIKDLDIMVEADDDDNDPADYDPDTNDDSDGLINTGSEANLKDIKIIDTDTGAVVMGPLELDDVADDLVGTAAADGTAEDALQIIDFSDDWTLDAGETRNLAVTADVDNGATADTEFAAVFDISGFVSEDSNGDTVTNVVPSGDIQGYTQTAKSASLVVSLASTPGDVTSVDGTDDVLVNAFSFVAGTASDLHVSSVKVSVYADEDNSGTFTAGDVYTTPPSTGPILLDVNDFVESCYLTDADGDMLGTAESPVSGGTSFTISNADWDLTAGATETLKVYCNFANPSDGTDDNAFAFDLADLSEDVVVQDEDGNDVDPTTDAPNGGTSPTNSVDLQDAGTLAATASSNTPSADLVMTGSTDNHVASYTFTATNEDFEVQTLSFSEEEGEDDLCGYSGQSATQLAQTSCDDSSQYANNISLVTISYPLEDGTMNEESAAMSGNEVKFNLTSGEYFYVPVGEPQDVDVYVNVPATARDAGGSATSNEEIRMGLFVDTTNDDNFKAVGVGSGATEDDDDESAIGNDRFATDGIATYVVRETKPTVSLSSSSPSGASVPGLIEVLRFNVAASSNEDVVLDQITFKVTSTSNGDTTTPIWNECDTDAAAADALLTSEFSIYESSNTSTSLDTADTDWVLWSTTGAICGTTAATLGFATIDFPTAQIVPKGSTETYILKMDVTGASAANDDALRVDINSDPALSTWIADANGVNATVLDESATSLDVDTPASYYKGDVLCLDVDDGGAADCDTTEEKMLIVDCDDATTDIACTVDPTVLRGYTSTLRTHDDDTLGTLIANTDGVLRSLGGLLWQDDGTTAEGTTYQTRWGGYLVDNLSLAGGTLVF